VTPKKGALLGAIGFAALALVLSLGIPGSRARRGPDVPRSRRLAGRRGGHASRSHDDPPAPSVSLAGPGVFERVYRKFFHSVDVTGRVEDEAGAPIANARVRAVHDPGVAPLEFDGAIEARTDADGDFALALEAGTDLVAVRAETDDPATGRATKRHLSPHWGDLDAGTLVLAPPCAITGTVVDESGAPIEGARLASVGSALGGLSGIEATTDANGAFRIPAVALGGVSIFRVEHAGFASRQAPGMRAGFPPATVVLQRAHAIRGVVRDSRGAPIGGANVFVSFDASLGLVGARIESFAATSGRDGTFAITGLSPGPKRLR
jgi:carboxypeptidase family protein